MHEIREALGGILHAIERSCIKPGDDLVIIGPGLIGPPGAMLARAKGVGKLFVPGLGVGQDRVKFAFSLGARPLEIDRDPCQEVIMQATDGKRTRCRTPVGRETLFLWP